MKIIERFLSVDGSVKYLQEVSEGLAVETSFFDREKKFVICYSSQIGCPIGCVFCKTGLLPLESRFLRSLTSEELLQQCLNIFNENKDRIDKKPDKPVLFSCMGGGEPFLNYKNVVHSFHELENRFPACRLAVSTSGIKPHFIKWLAHEQFKVYIKLQISIHAPVDLIRNRLVPNSQPVYEIVEAGRYYMEISKRPVSWNYILFEKMNDYEYDAVRLAKMLPEGSTVKLSFYNTVECCQLKPSQSSTLLMFRKVLEQGGMKTKYFVGDGLDVDASCGTLSFQYLFRSHP